MIVYKLRLPLEGKTYAGHQSDMKDLGKLARFSQLSVWAVGGVLGTNAIARDEMVKVVEERGRYRLDVYAPATGGTSPSRSPIRRLWFDRRLLVVQEDWLGSSGEVEATIQYDDFRPLEELGRVPAQAMGDQDVRLSPPVQDFSRRWSWTRHGARHLPRDASQSSHTGRRLGADLIIVDENPCG